MSRQSNIIMLVLVLALLAGLASQAEAQIGNGAWVASGIHVNSGQVFNPNIGWSNWQPALPRLGFFGYLITGRGLQVATVAPASKAAAIGLEPSDVILWVNRVPMSYPGAYRQGLQQALGNGGWVTLQIRDWRTGMVVTRTINLF